MTNGQFNNCSSAGRFLLHGQNLTYAVSASLHTGFFLQISLNFEPGSYQYQTPADELSATGTGRILFEKYEATLSFRTIDNFFRYFWFTRPKFRFFLFWEVGTCSLPAGRTRR